MENINMATKKEEWDDDLKQDFKEYNDELDNNLWNTLFEDEEYLARVNQEYESLGYDIGGCATEDKSAVDVVKDVVSELTKLQSGIITGEVGLIGLDGEETVIEDGYLGNEFGNLTKIGVLSRLVAIKSIGDIILKSMLIIDNDDTVLILDLKEDIIKFKESIEDDGKVQCMINDLEAIA